MRILPLLTALIVLPANIATAGPLTFIYEGDGGIGIGTIKEDRAPEIDGAFGFDQDANSGAGADVGRATATNSQIGFDAFKAALGGGSFAVEDFESFPGVDPASPQGVADKRITLDLPFNGTGSSSGFGGILDGAGFENGSQVDAVAEITNPNENRTGRFPVEFDVDTNQDIGGTKYIDTDEFVPGSAGVGSNNTLFVLAFDAPVTAFGFFGTDMGDYNERLSLQVYDSGDNLIETVQVPHRQIQDIVGSNAPDIANELNASLLFFGFTSTQAFKSIQFDVEFANSNTPDFFGFDNFVVGNTQPNPIPVPGGVLLVLSAAGCGLPLLRRCSRQAS